MISHISDIYRNIIFSISSILCFAWQVHARIRAIHSFPYINLQVHLCIRVSDRIPSGGIKQFGNIILQVLQISELLQYNGACSDRSVVILLVFLASQLFVKKNVVNGTKIMATSSYCHPPEFASSNVSLLFPSSFPGSIKFP